jgi:pimeloyl-ACP methyl ester carboxylesterase
MLHASARVLPVPPGCRQDLAPIVFLPALGFTGHSFAAVAAEMTCCRERVLVDLPGIGEGPTAAKVTCADIVAAVAEVLERVSSGGRPPVLVGHSIGGAIAVRLLAHYSARVESLILVGAAVAPFPFAWWEHWAAHPGLWAPLLGLFGAPKLVRMALPRVLHEPPIADGWDLDELGRQLADPVRRRTLVTYYRAFLSPKELALTARALGSVRGRVLFLRGARDHVLPNSVLAEAVGALPPETRAEVHVFPYGGHLLPLEAPAAVARAVDDFIVQVPLPDEPTESAPVPS